MTRYTKILNSVLLASAMVLGLTIVQQVVVKPESVSAAAQPGCYFRDITGTTTPSSCPPSLVRDPAKCYLSLQNNPPPGAGPYNPVDCATITVSGSCGDDCVSFGDPRKNDCQEDDLNRGNCEIVNWLIILINGLSALVGVVVVASIVAAGIKYSTSADDPKKVAEAKDRIRNSIIALVMFIFMYAFLQWIVPGGVL